MESEFSSLIDKLFPLSGVIAVVLIVWGMLLISPMDYFPTPDRAAEFFNQDPLRVQRGAILGGFYAVVFLLMFSSSLYRNVSLADRTDGMIPAFILAGGIILAVGFMVSNGIFWFAAGRAIRAGGLSPGDAIVYYDLTQLFLANVVTIGLAIVVGGTGLIAVQTNLFPTWLGWVSLIIAVGLLTPIHYIFEAVGILWIFVVSLLLI